MLAAPSSHGSGAVYWYPEECQAVTSAKADVSALGFVTLEMLMGQLPPALTRQGCEAKGVPDAYIRRAILGLRLQFCEEVAVGSSSFAEVDDLIAVLQAQYPHLLDLLQHMLRPDPATRWSAQQLIAHPCIRMLVAERCTELLRGHQRWQRSIHARAADRRH